jgi:hypothetical protein
MNFKFYYSGDRECAGKLFSESPGIILVRPLLETTILPYSGDLDGHKLLKFTRDNAVDHTLFEFDDKAVDLVWSEKNPAIVLFANDLNN